MSSYGTAVVIDVPDEASLETVTGDLVERGGDTYVTSAADGWCRATSYLPEPGALDELSEFLQSVGRARLAIAEDFDEYGALWAVLEVVGGEATTVHRRYILNADPADADAVSAAIDDLGDDPRSADVTGDEAVARAAELFGVPAAPVLVADATSANAYEEIGVIGGPFPWWEALGLPWPQPGAGTPIAG